MYSSKFAAKKVALIPQNANPREFTRIRPLRLSTYTVPEHLQNANPREFTRIEPLRLSEIKLQNVT